MNEAEEMNRLKTRALMLLSDQNGWSSSYKKNNSLLIESKASDALPGNIYRLTFDVKAPMQVVKETMPVIPGSRRLEWDTSFREIKEIKKLGENKWIQVSRCNGLGKGIISPREFVDIVECEETEDYCLITGGSIDYPEIESDDKYVRGFNGAIGCKIEKSTSGSDNVRLIFLSETDFRGKIPRALIDATLSTVVSGIANSWLKFLERCGYNK